jgi:hypothetical protein
VRHDFGPIGSKGMEIGLVKDSMLLQSLTLLASFVVAMLHHYSDNDTRRKSKVLQLCCVPCIFISCIICTNCAIAGRIRQHRTKLSSSLWLCLYSHHDRPLVGIVLFYHCFRFKHWLNAIESILLLHCTVPRIV